MKYIKTYESFRRRERVNEEILGAMWDKLKTFVKDSFSKGFSNLFGSAKEVDKIIEEYLSKVRSLSANKTLALQKYAEYINKVKQGAQIEETEAKTLSENYKKAELNFKKQLEILKKEFDIKFNEVMKDEKNPKIKNYLTLKRYEMERTLLSEDMKTLLGDADPEELKAELKKSGDNDALALINDIENRFKLNTQNIEGQVNALKEKGEENLGFDIELAKRKATEGGDPYVWENSPFPTYEFKQGDKIQYFSLSNKDVVSGEVVEVLGDDIKVKTDKGTWKVKKTAVVRSENYDKEEQEKKQAQENKNKPAQGQGQNEQL